MTNLPPPSAGRDPLIERLERLAERRSDSARTSVPGALAPPTLPRPPAQKSPNRPAAQPRRRHPAHSARVGALVMSCATAGGLAYLFAGLNTTQAANTSLAALPAPVAVVTPTTAASTAASTAAPASTTAPSATASSAASTTTVAASQPAVAAVTAYNGDVVDTRYGPVQVQVQITDGAVSEVAVVEYPDGDGKSVRINARALPTLRTEVLTAQSAQIDTVSGATYTSDAYRQSLQSAIDQARAAGSVAAA